MPDGRHMYPNLVGASCLQTALDIGIILKTFQHLIMCDSFFSVFLVDRHPLSVLLIPADGRTYCPLVLFYHAVYDGTVTPVQGMCLQLLRYPPVCRVVFTDNEGTSRVPVDPVHDSRAQNAVNPGKLPLAVIQGRVDQRPAVMSGRRMHHHPFGFINHKYVGVLVEHGKRYIFRLYGRFHRLRNLETHLVVHTQPVIRLAGQTAHHDLPLLDTLLNIRTGKVRNRVAKPLVKTLSVLPHPDLAAESIHLYSPIVSEIPGNVSV